MAYKKSIFLFGLIFCLLLTAQPATKGLDEFLSKQAVKVNTQEVLNGINRFLNYKVEKGRAVWFKGNIETKEGDMYKDLRVNFNVLDNSLYVLYNREIYKVSNFAMKSFEINQKGELLKFEKGYAVAFGSNVKANFDGSTQELIAFLTEYLEFSDLPIKDISISEGLKTSFKIELRTGFRDQVSGLKKYLGLSTKITDLESHFGVSEISESKYLQVLFEHENFTVLKYHFKRSSGSQSVSLVEQSGSSFLFAEEDYFIADSGKQLEEFLFTKKSLEKALLTLDINYTEKLKNVGSEKGVIAWFENNTFN